MPYQHQGLNTPPNPFHLPQQSATPNNNPNTNVPPGGATKTPLTPEQLTKLYSMGPYAISPRPTPSPATSQQPIQTASINPYVQPVSAFVGAYPNIASPITSHILAQHTLAHNQYHQASASNAFSQQQQQQQQLLFNQSASVSSQSDSIASANYSTYIQNASMNSSSPIQNQSAILRPIIGNVTNPDSALVHVPKVSSYLKETKIVFFWFISMKLGLF